MMKSVRSTYCIYFLFTAVLLQFSEKMSFSQDRTLYYMDDLPQAIKINPAFYPYCEGYINFPVLNSFHFNYDNSSFTFKDFIHKGEGSLSDSLIFDLENLEDRLHNSNALSASSQIQIGEYGFRYKDMFFSVGLSHHTNVLFRYPDDILEIKDGNWQPDNDNPYGKTKDIDLSGLSMNMSSFLKFGVSVQKQFTRQLSLGIKASYLSGIFNVMTKNADIRLLTDESISSINAVSDYRLYSSFPFHISENEEGHIDDLEIPDNIRYKDFLFKNNHGFSLDLGIRYLITHKIYLSASLLDLGMMFWNDNTYELHSKSNFEYTGISAQPVNNTIPNITESYEDLADSLKKDMEFVKTHGKGYSNFLSPKLYAGVKYKVMEDLNFAALLKSNFYNYLPSPQLTFSMNSKPYKFLTASLSYTIMNRTFNNVGAGLGLTFNYFHFYIVNDNIYGLIFPHKTRNINIRFGMSLVLGRRKMLQYSFLD